jgi:hypothetical protein
VFGRFLFRIVKSYGVMKIANAFLRIYIATVEPGHFLIPPPKE